MDVNYLENQTGNAAGRSRGSFTPLFPTLVHQSHTHTHTHTLSLFEHRHRQLLRHPSPPAALPLPLPLDRLVEQRKSVRSLEAGRTGPTQILPIMYYRTKQPMIIIHCAPSLRFLYMLNECLRCGATRRDSCMPTCFSFWVVLSTSPFLNVTLLAP
jgi:hypothetical protein